MNSFRAILFGGVLMLVAVAQLPTQASPCLTQADSVTKFRRLAGNIFRTTDSTTAIAAGQPWARIANIQLVTDSTVCATAVAAYNSAVRATGTEQAATAGYVLALGGTGYAYARPDESTPAGTRPIFLFTPNWTYVATAQT